jgi:hypothetical protein
MIQDTTWTSPNIFRITPELFDGLLFSSDKSKIIFSFVEPLSVLPYDSGIT